MDAEAPRAVDDAPEAGAYTITHEGDRFWLGLSTILFVLAVFCYGIAEIGWMASTTGRTSIGVGTSAYQAIPFQRSVALAALSAAAAIIGIARRSTKLG